MNASIFRINPYVGFLYERPDVRDRENFSSRSRPDNRERLNINTETRFMMIKCMHVCFAWRIAWLLGEGYLVTSMFLKLPALFDVKTVHPPPRCRRSPIQVYCQLNS